MNENEREMERRASISQLTQMRSVTVTVKQVLYRCAKYCWGGTTTELRTQLHTTYIQFTRTRTLPGTLED